MNVSVTVNEIDDASSNPGWNCCTHFAIKPLGMSSLLLPAIGKIAGRTGISLFGSKSSRMTAVNSRSFSQLRETTPLSFQSTNIAIHWKWQKKKKKEYVLTMNIFTSCMLTPVSVAVGVSIVSSFFVGPCLTSFDGNLSSKSSQVCYIRIRATTKNINPSLLSPHLLVK